MFRSDFFVKNTQLIYKCYYSCCFDTWGFLLSILLQINRWKVWILFFKCPHVPVFYTALAYYITLPERQVKNQFPIVSKSFHLQTLTLLQNLLSTKPRAKFQQLSQWVVNTQPVPQERETYSRPMFNMQHRSKNGKIIIPAHWVSF